MNTFTTDHTAAQTIARQMIAERVRDAEERRIARSVRDQRRADARASRRQPGARSLSGWAFRLVRPAH